MTASFIPCYDTEELKSLIKNWLNGSLDGIHSRHAVIPGVEDCDRPASGLRAEGLLTRFMSADVERVIAAMAADVPVMAALFYEQYALETPIEDIARAHQQDASEMMVQAIEARDEFMRRLLMRRSDA